MPIKVGINGFGRIGRNVYRAALNNPDVEIVAVNDLTDNLSLAHLLKYDSILGPLGRPVEHGADFISVDGKKIKVFETKDPAEIDWSSLGCEIVVESTGRFTDADQAKKHLRGTVKKVIISAPAKGEDLTIVLGVNDGAYDAAKHNIISNASCTTNCLGPVAKVLNDTFGIEKGSMTTIHSYTNDQQVLDLPHKDLRRSRAAAINMIPTSTGAAKAIGLVLPELKGKLDGYAMRVPTPNVSVVDFVAVLKEAGDGRGSERRVEGRRRGSDEGHLGLHGRSGGVERHDAEPEFVDCRRGDDEGARRNALQGGGLYDNEWGYSNRVVDLIGFLAKKGL